MRANLSFTQNYTLNRKAFPGGAGGMFGRRVLLFRKSWALIVVAPWGVGCRGWGRGGDLACVFVQSYGKRAVDFAGVSSRYVHFLES